MHDSSPHLIESLNVRVPSHCHQQTLSQIHHHGLFYVLYAIAVGFTYTYFVCVVLSTAVPTVSVTPNVTDIRRFDNGESAQSVCRGVGDRVTVRWNTSELDPDVEFDVSCVNGGSVCRLQLRGPLPPARVHCIAANDVGNDVHPWTLYASGRHSHLLIYCICLSAQMGALQ